MTPVFLMFQARAILQVLLGRDGGWPAQSRGDGRLTLAEAWESAYWITLTGAIAMALTRLLAPDLVPWLMPVTLPMVAAPLIIWWTSRPARTGLFLTPDDMAPAAVIHRHDAILARWHGDEQATSEPDPADLRHA